MRHHRNRVWLATAVGAILFNSTLTSVMADPLSGTRTIGPTGDYHSITAAIADIQAQTLGGPLVLELQSSYVSTVETFPIVFNNLTTTAANTLTLRPQTGASNLIISPGTATPTLTVDLNGAQFVTIDGRPGGVGSNVGSGVGTASQLTIVNSNISSGSALRFYYNADNNTVTYVTLQGVTTSTGSGVILFHAAPTGNNNNVIDHCDIRDGSHNPPAIGIYSNFGNNSSNIIANCNIYNFFGFGLEVYGGTDWTITGNSFFQTVPRAALTTYVGAINISSLSGNNFVVSSNAIGGSGSNASGGWTVNGISAVTRFAGITLNVGSTIPSSVQGNVIRNFSWLTSDTLSTMPGVWGGITISGGSANIVGNVIGDTGYYSINVTSAAGGNCVSSGISSTSTNTVVIANNQVTSINVGGTTNTIATSLTGIGVTAGVNIISNNVVGAIGNFSALLASTSVGSGQDITGIFSSSSNSAVISGNLVTGLNNQYIGGFGGRVRGILVSDGINTITGNTIRYLTTATAYGGSYSSVSMLGISVSSTLPSQTVSQNTVYSLFTTSTTGSVSVTGIDFNGAAGASSLLAQNRVYDLEVVSTNISSAVNGFSFTTGTFTMENNMASVGIELGGSSTGSASLVYGIYDGGSDPNRNFYHNSIYLGGTQVSSGTRFTAACYSRASNNTRAFENNIFVNARSRSGGTSLHYAFYNSGSDLTGLTSDGNILFANGTGHVTARYNSTLCTNLTDWQAATSLDPTSLAADPLFVNSASDLHISSSSPAINAGQPVGVTTDFDGDPRNATTPTIGADELFDYTLVPGYNLLTAQWLGGGTNALGFHGMPNSGYALEMATNLVPPVLWQPLLTNVSGTDGSLSFTNVTSQTPVFYRTRYAP